MDADTSKGLKLLFCVIGIYVCFLTWGVLQERISTVDYRPNPMPHKTQGHAAWIHSLFHKGIQHLQFILYWTVSRLLALFGYQAGPVSDAQSSAKFESFIFLNLCQSLGSMVIAFFVLRAKTGRWPLPNRSTLGSLMSHAHQDQPSSSPSVARHWRGFPPMTRALFFHYIRVSLCFSCASPFGYASLKYIGYVTMNLGKSCKLLPLVFIGLLFKKQKLDRLKLLSVLFITAGVTGFMLFDDKAAKKAAAKTALPLPLPLPLVKEVGWFSYEQWFGIVLLLTNLMLDGAMNTWQEDLFKHYAVSSFHMMYHMNWMSVLLMLFALLSGLTNELPQAIQFILTYPPFLLDLCLFAACGALGQAVVFYTIENFGAVSLVTVTVTRKLFTILISVFYFGHALNIWQWASVGTVFVALGLEAYMSMRKARTAGRLMLVKDSMPHVHVGPFSRSHAHAKEGNDSDSTTSIPSEWNRPLSETTSRLRATTTASVSLLPSSHSASTTTTTTTMTTATATDSSMTLNFDSIDDTRPKKQ